ncbi:dihydroneopterin triphosphate diphosphatase [Uliginosibacterium sp. H1]|uniref:dihydroneopterin triphosphate diphosphatase n=1 Tax=Uliginosibacterium sp. H1 TaxID=3114757 RepID=UPI002E19A4AB|nr:dihydroneopterin triphosphate diphosphatase [Uliginosibacterium sp. H1]
MDYKTPESVLVLVHTPALQILLLERARHPGYWQSVTGSLEAGELPRETARRELFEETGIEADPAALQDWRLANRFEILQLWRHRYAPGVTHNVEHVFSLCVPEAAPVQLAQDEHRDQCWLSWQDAADRCFSWTNRDAIAMLAQRDPTI